MYILTPTLTLKISEEMQTLSPKSISLKHNHDSDNSSKRKKKMMLCEYRQIAVSYNQGLNSGNRQKESFIMITI